MQKTGKSVKSTLHTKTGKWGWAEAIAQAEEHLQKNRLQAARLRAAIRTFREMAQAGKPWPGRVFGQNR
jgi:hypothetical protein